MNLPQLPPVQDGIVIKYVLSSPGYAIDTEGCLWSAWIGRKHKVRIGTSWKRLRGSKTKAGYISCLLHGSTKPVYIHRLVLETFIGPCPPGMECRHLNGNPSDNRLVNLTWGTPHEQALDKLRHGTHKGFLNGESHPQAVMTDEVIRQLRVAAIQGTPFEELSRTFGISKAYASHLATGRIRPEAGGPFTKRGKAHHGESNRSAKLTQQQVIEIRALYRTGRFSHQQLGEAFGVSGTAIGFAVRLQTWRIE